MNQYQQLVEDIVLMVNDDRLYSPDEVEALAAQYRNAVKNVNKRLLFCEELLQKGFRSEVVQEADRSPNLIDSVGMLDFDDLEFFKDMVKERRLKALPTIRTDIISEINECYSGNNLVDRLLRHFRLASLSLAPIKVRLRMLRQLHMMDPTNLGWEADVLVYEKARISQIQTEVIEATRSENLRMIESLYAELKSSEWIEKPTSAIARSIESTIAKFQLNEARNKAETYLKDLQTAFQEQDLETAIIIKESIESIVSDYPTCLDNNALQFVDGVNNWIDRQNHLIQIDIEYRNYLTQLDEMLDNRDSYDNVERICAAIDRLEKPISDDRLRRIRSLKEEAATQGRRKFTLIFAASIVILIATGITTGMIYQSKSRTRRVLQFDTNLATMIQNNRLDEAEKEIERIEKEDPIIAKRPEIVKRITELATVQDNNQKRINEYNEITDQITTVLANGKGTMGELDKAEALVSTAAGLARDPSEKGTIDRFKTEIITARSANQKQIDDTFLAKFNPLQEKAEQENSDFDSVKAILEQLLQLKQNSNGTRAELVRLIDPITAQLQNQIVQIETKLKEDEDRNRLTDKFNSLTSYINGLKQFVQLQPKSTHSSQIRTVLESDSIVGQDLEAMEALQSKLKSINTTQIKTNEAKQLVAEWKRLATRLRFHPAVESEPDIIKFLTRISNRIDEDGNSLVSKIMSENGLGHPLIQTAKLVCDKKDNTYYLASQPAYNVTYMNYNIRMYMDTELRRTSPSSIRYSDIDRDRTSLPSWQNPLKPIVNDIASRLKDAEGNSWDELMGKLILDIQSSRKIDSIQKYRCLSIVIPVAISGSNILNEVFADHMKVISTDRIDMNINWAIPDSIEMNIARAKVEDTLKRLPMSELTEKSLKVELNKSHKFEIGDVFSCVGAIHRNELMEWKLSLSNQGTSLDGNLYIYDPNAAKPSLVKVGTKAGSQIEFTESGKSLLQDFRVIWVHAPSSLSSAD